MKLVTDERFVGKIKWYLMPIVFGGDPMAESNTMWVSHEQHAELVRWWNNLYRSLKGFTQTDAAEGRSAN